MLKLVVFRVLGRIALICLIGALWLGYEMHAHAEDQPAESEAGRVDHFSFFNGWPREEYALDGFERFVQPGQRPDCPRDELVTYRGTHLRYRGGARVHQVFVPRLEKFEALVVELATEHYGRPPRRILHRGAYNCRIARGRRGRISEHALGNALDLQGFEFPLLRRARGEVAPEAMPRFMRRAFQVKVRDHWTGRRLRYRYHAIFLHKVADALRQRPDIFRGIVGPPRPRHADHLHLDVAPWRYAMYGYDPVAP